MVMEYFQKNPQAVQQISGPIFEDKVIDFILEMAKVTDVTIDTDTLYNTPEDAAPAKKVAAKKPTSKKSATKKAVAKKTAAKKPTAKRAAAKKTAAEK
jgi:trigger factor